MYIFTPNTLIKSAEINANFDEQDARLDILETAIYAYGTLGSELTGYKTMTETANNGITKTNSTTYTIATAGLYTFYAQQLMTASGGSNFFSYVNGVGIHHGWQNAIQKDAITSFTRQLAVGDTVRLYVDVNVTAVWTGNHSCYYLNRIGN